MADDPTPGNASPLDGIRVLDLTRVLAGPWASQLLADFGADVIKVEKPGSGDDTRQWGPPWLGGDAAFDSAYFLSANRNKRSITLNLGEPEGADIIRQLVANSDVLLENFRVGTLARFGLDYEALSAVNPSLIYCSLSAYGQTGSRAGMPGYDAMMQASGGLMSVTGEEEGAPQKVGVAIADIMAGMYMASAVTAALVQRERTGAGQFIDVALYDAQVAWLANQNMNYLVGGQVPGRLGTAHPNLVPYQSFATRDGHVMLAIGNDAQFSALAECVDDPGLAADPDYSTNAARVANRDALVADLSEHFLRRDTAQWLDVLGRRGIPAGPINSIETVLTEDYAAERELVRRVPHSQAGDTPTVANPVRFSGSSIRYDRAPPVLGEHTREILCGDLGYSEEEIRRLEKAGVL